MQRHEVHMSNSIVKICKNCNIKFIYRVQEQEVDETRKRKATTLCFTCRKMQYDKWKREKEEKENNRNKIKKEKEWERAKQKFEEELKEWNVLPIESISVDEEKTLYILGNGFDLMHGVQSSYYAFRDSMGKRNEVRRALEDYFKVADLWANLEEALAHFDLNVMCNSYAMDAMLDMMDAYGEDAGAAEYYMAVEYAIEPLRIISVELPKKFRTWVESLEIGTDDRPLLHLFGNGRGKVFSFNYTEFPEVMYRIQPKNICYIHGCRKKIKYQPKEELILGHLPGLSDESYYVEEKPVWKKNPYNRYLVETAQENAIHMAAQYDDSFTKKCSEIIEKKEAFFHGLSNIQNVVVIGHSMSQVDWDYFVKIRDSMSKDLPVKWYIGCHGIGDLNNLKKMCKAGIFEKEAVNIFRTDKISVKFYEKKDSEVLKPIPKERCLAMSQDQIWKVHTVEKTLTILKEQQMEYQIEFHASASRAVFLNKGKQLLVHIGGVYPAIYLLERQDEGWNFVNELLPVNGHSIMNTRLNHIYVDDKYIRFIYNNRVYKYNIESGLLVSNTAVRNAGLKSYTGEDIYQQFRIH